MIIATYLPEIVYKLASLYWDEARCIVRCPGRKVDRFETNPASRRFSFSSVPRASSCSSLSLSLRECILELLSKRDFLILKRNCEIVLRGRRERRRGRQFLVRDSIYRNRRIIRSRVVFKFPVSRGGEGRHVRETFSLYKSSRTCYKFVFRNLFKTFSIKMMYLIHFAKELLTSNNFATGLPCEPYP